MDLARSILNVVREIPAFGYVLAFPLFAVFWPAIRRRAANPLSLLLGISAVLGLLTLLAYVSLNVVSLHSFLLSDDEANILSIAAAVLHGQPAYPSIHSYNFSYGLVYGPLTFVAPSLLFRIFPGAFWPLHASVVLINFLLCAVIWLTARSRLSPRMSLAILAYPLAPYLRIIDHSLGLRPEVGLFFFTSLATLFTLTGPPLAASLLVGLCAGFALGFKLTTLPAIAFLFLLLFRLRGIRATAAATGALIVATLLPFLVPRYSLHNYLESLLNSRSEPPVNFLAVCILFALSLLLPFVVLRCFGIRPWSPPKTRFGAIPELTVLTAGLIASALIAAKPGGGLWHICQFLPVLTGYLVLTLATPVHQQTRPASRMAVAFSFIVLSSAISGLSYTFRDIHSLQPPPADQLLQARSEINNALRNFPDQILQVGYGPNSNALPSLLRFIPVLRGQPYTLDGSGRIEVNPDPFPPGILNRMNHCTNDLWLVPTGQSPFDTPIFPRELHNDFVTHYAIVQRNRVYDIWSCKAG